MSDGFDLAELTDSIRAVLREEWPLERLQKHCDGESLYSESLWQSAASLGWLALPIAEVHGGMACGHDALAVLYRELGARLAAIPVLPTLLSAELIARGGTREQQERWLPRIASGELRAGITLPGEAVAAAARIEAGRLQLSGRALHVLDGGAVDLVFVAVDLAGRHAWVAVEGARKSVVRIADRSRSLATLELDTLVLPIESLVGERQGAVLEDALFTHAAIALAADSVGGGEEILAYTIDYLKERTQFGRVLGSFQALKHRVADHKTALVAAGCLLEGVATRAAAGEAALADAIAAKAYTARLYAEIARDCIQLFGGIGYTWEHFAHRFLKHAKTNEVLGGSERRLLDRLAALLEAA